jgi:hypothetical protein
LFKVLDQGVMCLVHNFNFYLSLVASSLTYLRSAIQTVL